MATLSPSPDFFSARCCAARKFSVINPTNVRKRVVGFRACSRVKDLEVLNKTGNDVEELLFGQLSAPLLELSTMMSSSTEVDKEEEQKRKYYLNTGYAIRILREDFPKLFYNEPSFDIYRDDIVFKDPLNTFTGIENYKSIFWALRFHGRMFFKSLWIDIVSVWQPVEGMLMIRWTVHGIPRVPWESCGRFDGTSEYKLDKDGKIYEHRVHNIALNAPPKFRVLTVQDLIGYISCPSTPKPTFFKISFSSLGNITSAVKVAELRHRLGSVIASLKRDKEEQEHSQQT